MEFNPKTFCAAPWFQIRNEQFSEYRPCAVINIDQTQFKGCTNYSWPASSPEEYLNSNYSAYLRKNLTEGVALPECRYCWQQESLDQQSPRLVANGIVTVDRQLEQSWVKSYLKHKTDYTHDHLITADVKLTNTCNFACAMCNPKDSSQIYASWSKSDHPVIKILLDQQPDLLEQVKRNYKDKNNHELLRLLLTKSPKFLKLLGGEPLLDRDSIKILQSVELEKQKKIELLFITNGSVDLCASADALKGYKGINFVISLESIGAVQDYVRKGSNWQQIEQNIDRWVNSRSANNLNIHITVQALNILHIEPLMDWAKIRGIKVDMGILEQPNFLSLAAVPDKIRKQVPDKFQNLLAASPHDPSLTLQLRDYVDWYDPNGTWQTVLPEWLNVLK